MLADGLCSNNELLRRRCLHNTIATAMHRKRAKITAPAKATCNIQVFIRRKEILTSAQPFRIHIKSTMLTSKSFYQQLIVIVL